MISNKEKAEITYRVLQERKKRREQQLNSDWDGIYAHRCKLGRKVVGEK